MTHYSAKTRRLRVVLGDDHGLVRSGLRSLLERDQEFEVVGEASSSPSSVFRLLWRLWSRPCRSCATFAWLTGW